MCSSHWSSTVIISGAVASRIITVTQTITNHSFPPHSHPHICSTGTYSCHILGLCFKSILCFLCVASTFPSLCFEVYFDLHRLFHPLELKFLLRCLAIYQLLQTNIHTQSEDYMTRIFRHAEPCLSVHCHSRLLNQITWFKVYAADDSGKLIHMHC